MDDEAEKMVALKKAYAEIILNTAKEAATRIMVSERKALRFQQDLSASKEEALRMLLRLKQMIDSKTTEAELTSLSQQRRIAVLEAQLQEAEEVITDLRAELQKIGDELEKVKNNQVQPLNEKISQEGEIFSEKSAHFPSSGCETMETSDMKDMLTNQRVLDDKCCSNMKQNERLISSGSSDLDNFDHSKSDLASIIMRSKKPELYRHGCTQRIHAFERNFLDEKLSPEYVENNGNPLNKDEFVTKAAGKEACKVFSRKHDEMGMEKLSPGERERPIKVRTSRRRKTRFGKAKTLRRSHQGQLLKSGQPPSASFHCKASLLNGNDSSSEALDGLKQKLECESCNRQDEILLLHKGQRMRTSKSGNHVEASSACTSGQLAKPCKPSPLLSRCRTIAYLLNGGIESVEDESKTCENEAKVKPLPPLGPGLTLTKSDVKSTSRSTSVIMDVEATNKAENMLAKHESDVIEESRFPSSELNIELENTSLLNCDQDTTKASERLNESPCPVDNNRLLKYTFQRKRKKEAFSSPDEIASPEKSSVRRKTMEEYTESEPQKSRLMDESSRDSRRLAQVARQLISLSGKRWR